MSSLSILKHRNASMQKMLDTKNFDHVEISFYNSLNRVYSIDETDQDWNIVSSDLHEEQEKFYMLVSKCCAKMSKFHFSTDKSTIFVGTKTTVDFINYVRENYPLIKFNFARDFLKMIHENTECCQILEIMNKSQYPYDFHNYLIINKCINGKNTYQMCKRDIDTTIFDYIKNNNLITKWKISFRIKNY